ncbi:hypothetical protein Tco_0766226 [Tanacetum coccineum]
MKPKRRLIPTSVGVGGCPLSVEDNVVSKGCGVSAIPFDASSVRPTVSTPCFRHEVRAQLDGSSSDRRLNELKRNVVDQANVPLKKTCVRPLSSPPYRVSPIGSSVGRSKRNASSLDDGDNVFDIGPSVPLKRPCVRQLNSHSERVVLNTHLMSQSANPVNGNTSSVPIDEHHDDAHHGVHIGAARVLVPDRGFRQPAASFRSRQVPTVSVDDSQQHSRQSPAVNTDTSRQQPCASGPPPDYKYLRDVQYHIAGCAKLTMVVGCSVQDIRAIISLNRVFVSTRRSTAKFQFDSGSSSRRRDLVLDRVFETVVLPLPAPPPQLTSPNTDAPITHAQPEATQPPRPLSPALSTTASNQPEVVEPETAEIKQVQSTPPTTPETMKPVKGDQPTNLPRASTRKSLFKTEPEADTSKATKKAKHNK